MKQEEIEKLREVGKIAVQVKSYARELIKPGMLLLNIAEKIEEKMIILGAKPAFPVNLSINEIAAHATPSSNEKETAFGLLKVDIGVHKDGFIADTAFTLDLENSDENKILIEAAEKALESAVKEIKIGIALNKIGEIIESTMKNFKVSPIRNLSGHSIEQYNLHAGITIPNFNNSQQKTLQSGVYAVEPFATNGFGSVRDGKLSGIYMLKKEGNVRDSIARQLLHFIKIEYNTLPFCTRWLEKKFGSRALLAVKRLEEAGLLHNYPMLIESGKGKVAQAEHTIILTKTEKIITTL